MVGLKSEEVQEDLIARDDEHVAELPFVNFYPKYRIHMFMCLFDAFPLPLHNSGATCLFAWQCLERRPMMAVSGLPYIEIPGQHEVS